MSRTDLKCVAASSSLHLLLVLVLFVGPAFVSPKPPQEPPLQDNEILDFVPLITTDEQISGGGNPKANPPPAIAPIKEPARAPEPAPKEPETKPEPKPEPKHEVKVPKAKREPEPEPEPVKKSEPKLDPDALEPAKKKPRRPEISTEIVTRKNNKADEARKKALEREREAERERVAEEERQYSMAVDSRRRLANTFNMAANNLAEGMSSGTSIELRGPGGGGVPYANFLQAVKSIYARNWHVPDGVTDDNATATADVTIARDGKVVTAKITVRSGNAEVDKSVQRTLDRVDYAAPLPQNASEDRRTVSIKFNVRARRLMQ